MWLVVVVGRCVVGCKQCWMWLVAVVRALGCRMRPVLDVVGSGCGALRCRV